MTGSFFAALAWEESKRSLFCKKAPQKTFAPEPVLLKPPVPPGQKSFLLLFFKKEALSCLSVHAAQASKPCLDDAATKRLQNNHHFRDTPMRDNSIHNLFQVLTGQIHDQLALGAGLRAVMVVLAWVLFFGGLGIAAYCWASDREQRSAHHLATFAMRFLSAGMWYLGTLWKMPWPVAHGFKDWLTNCVTYSQFQWHAELMQFFLDHIAIVDPLVCTLELGLAASFALGFAVRLSGLVAALFIFNLLIGLYNDPTEWVWTYVGIMCAHGMFSASSAGRSLGLDYLLARRKVFAPCSRVARLHALVA